MPTIAHVGTSRHVDSTAAGADGRPFRARHVNRRHLRGLGACAEVVSALAGERGRDAMSPRILLVEDNQANADMLSRRLKGHAVTETKPIDLERQPQKMRALPGAKTTP